MENQGIVASAKSLTSPKTSASASSAHRQSLGTERFESASVPLLRPPCLISGFFSASENAFHKSDASMVLHQVDQAKHVALIVAT